ncbi:thiol peroxidase (atypical 2-Cys peroxiredoxin) [Natronincola peptidivorans]|uniref:Thiol peroxidase n=1 Tax=Natronincola peptidivorans TaxID=426128 RepID=A0A1I0BYG7_9FIRM|nr:thiol peroxidase [Natronincola peptidivorans]SET11473.1 thiol peroxidase (atypical 2-Cys peroxiredoxin) [Natronincola peptidivorans]
MEKRTDVITMKGNPLTLVGKEIKVGDKAPDFSVVTKELKSYSLNDLGSGVKLISVVPSIDTGVCDLQTMHFNDEAAKLKEVTIVTISMDLPFALDRYCAAKAVEQLKTLSDHRNASFGENYGFLIEELRLLTRGVVILDKDNIVRYVEYVPEVTNQPDYNQALEEVKKLL